MSDLAVPDLVGFLGVGLIVVTYFLSQIGRMQTTRAPYPAINGAGALLILFSLYHRPNPPSIVIECFWLMISAIGLVRALRKRPRD